jgi:hypothetical protein
MLGTDVAQVHLSAETLTKQREHHGDLTEGDHAILPAPTQQPNGCAAAGGEPYSDTPTRRSGLVGIEGHERSRRKFFDQPFLRPAQGARVQPDSGECG